jgi:adenylate kinase family enzyme
MNAVLLFGHSNAGKSPLGALIERRASSPARRFRHLDFGEHLRMVLAGSFDAGLSDGDKAYVRTVMNGGLLDDAHFPVARRIIEAFISGRGCRSGNDALVLNGIPRHMGQARGLAAMGVKAEAIIYLRCPAGVAYERKVRADKGAGHEDRSRRDDADIDIFKRKIVSFELETAPLIDWYQSQGAKVLTIDVTTEMTPAEMYERFRSLGAQEFKI